MWQHGYGGAPGTGSDGGLRLCLLCCWKMQKDVIYPAASTSSFALSAQGPKCCFYSQHLWICKAEWAYWEPEKRSLEIYWNLLGTEEDTHAGTQKSWCAGHASFWAQVSHAMYLTARALMAQTRTEFGCTSTSPCTKLLTFVQVNCKT